jgi:hypothetical protein
MPIRGFSARRLLQESQFFRVHYSADPERGSQWQAQERKKYTSQAAWDREQEIIHEAGGGERLFAEVLSRWEEKILIDPRESGFQPSPHWKRIAGFDHGKANPTAALVGCLDYDGVLYILGEYYQPGLSPRQHRPNLMTLEGFLRAEALADPSIFYKTQAQSDGTFKAIADLYLEEGIANLAPAPSNNELTGMERILSHWVDLDARAYAQDCLPAQQARYLAAHLWRPQRWLPEPALGAAPRQKGRAFCRPACPQKSLRENC